MVPWLAGVLRVPDSYRYNGIVGASLLLAGTMALSIEHMRTSWRRHLLLVLGLITLMIFVFQHNHAAVSAYAMNQP